MDCGLPDNSGVNHDLPLSQKQRFPGRGRGFLQRKSVIGGSGQFPRAHIDMEIQIHHVEQEAYTSVLRAFKAQSDAITWEKESLITELRKELRVSDEEHRELLSRVNAEDIISEIREWRTASGLQPGMPSVSRPSQDGKPGPIVSASCKKTKTSQSEVSMSLEVPSSMWRPSIQPSAFAAGAKGQKSLANKGIIHGTRRGGTGHGLKMSVSRGTSVAGGGRGGGSLKGDYRSLVPESRNGTGRDSFGDIEILHTDTLIKEVEQFISANHPDPAELEKVKKMLKDHEKDLMDAIARLEDASDGESGTSFGFGSYKRVVSMNKGLNGERKIKKAKNLKGR